MKDPTIENVGNNDAYIRAKIEIVSENENFTADRAAEVEAALDVTMGGTKVRTATTIIRMSWPLALTPSPCLLA